MNTVAEKRSDDLADGVHETHPVAPRLRHEEVAHSVDPHAPHSVHGRCSREPSIAGGRGDAITGIRRNGRVDHVHTTHAVVLVVCDEEELVAVARHVRGSIQRCRGGGRPVSVLLSRIRGGRGDANWRRNDAG